MFRRSLVIAALAPLALVACSGSESSDATQPESATVSQEEYDKVVKEREELFAQIDAIQIELDEALDQIGEPFVELADMTGVTLEELRPAAEAFGLILYVIDGEDVPTAKVVEQSPPPGFKAPPGSVVAVSVSSD